MKMKILEFIFLGLTILVPSFFIGLALANIKKVKANKKFRTTLIKLIFLTLIINGTIWGVLKMTNSQKPLDEDKQITDNEQDKDQNLDDENEKDENDKNENDPKPTEPDTPDDEPTVKDPSDGNSNSKPNTDKPQQPTDANNNTSTGVTPNGFAIEVKNGVTYIDGILIVNKTYPLPSTYIPANSQVPVTTANCANCLDKEAYAAYTKMKNDAASQGMGLWIASGYRSYSYQSALYGGYVNSSGKLAADTYSARPGHSEHQSGFAFNLNTVSESFANTKEGKWVNENCHKYGFIIRYPKGKDNETGYIYEPWHLRFVGVDLATKLYNGGNWITMETYFGVTSTYQN